MSRTAFAANRARGSWRSCTTAAWGLTGNGRSRPAAGQVRAPGQVPASLKGPALLWSRSLAGGEVAGPPCPYVTELRTGNYLGKREPVASAFTLGAAVLLLGPLRALGRQFGLVAAMLIASFQTEDQGRHGDVFGAMNEFAELAGMLFLGRI